MSKRKTPKMNDPMNLKNKNLHTPEIHAQIQGQNSGGGSVGGGKWGNTNGVNHAVNLQRDQDGDYKGRKGKN